MLGRIRRILFPNGKDKREHFDKMCDIEKDVAAVEQHVNNIKKATLNHDNGWMMEVPEKDG